MANGTGCSSGEDESKERRTTKVLERKYNVHPVASLVL